MNLRAVLSEQEPLLYAIAPEATIAGCVESLSSYGIGAMVVLDDESRLCGIISERDIIRAAPHFRNDLWDLPVQALMTPRWHLVTAKPSDSLQSVMERMGSRNVRHVPVLIEGQVVSLLSMQDIVRALLEHTTRENEEIREQMNAPYFVSNN